MTHVIAQACIGVKSGECVDVCPVDCIHPRLDAPGFAGATQLYIDREVCIDCGACASVCPVSAIFPEADVPADQKHFSAINNAFFRKGAPVPAAAAAPASAAAQLVTPGAAPSATAAKAGAGGPLVRKIELVQTREPSPPEEGPREASTREREFQKKAPVLLDKGRLFS